MAKDNKKERAEREIPKPVDVVDGIPDRAARPRKWMYILLAAIFLAWVAVLIYIRLASAR